MRNQLKYGVHGIHGQLLQRTLEHISRITPLGHLGRYIISTGNKTLWNIDCEMIPSMYVLMVFVVLVVHHSAEHIARTDHIAANIIRIHNSAALHICSQRINNWLILGGLCIKIPNRNQIMTRIKRYQLADILHETAAAGTVILAPLTEDGVRASREAVQIEVI